MIAAFSTFISLSFTKSLYITFSIASIGHYYVNGIKHSSLVLDPSFHKIDNNNQLFFTLISTWYFIPSVLIVIFTYFPVIPFEIFCKLLRCCCGGRKYHTIYVFMNTFQGHYKDSINGSRDYSLNFLLRLEVLWRSMAQIKVPIEYYSFVIYALILTSLFYGIVQPCKKNYMNVIESLLYCTAGLLLSFGSLHYNPNFIHSILYNFSMVLVVLPSLSIFVWKIRKLTRSCKKGLHHSVSGASLSDGVPDREIHSTDYTPLLNNTPS